MFCTNRYRMMYIGGMARPREFDREQALERAMQLFWEHGYDRTSTALLEEGMGIRRSSLYATFGSKDALFAEALDRYVENLRTRAIAPLGADGPALAALRDFFARVTRRGGPGGDPLRCCLVVRTSLSREALAPEIVDRVERAVAELDEAFFRLLQRAKAEGTLRPGASPRRLARFLTTTFQAINVAAHAGRSQRELADIVEPALAVLE